MKTIYLLLPLFLFPGNIDAQFNRITQRTNRPVQYEKTEIEVELNAQWKNPYLQEDIALDMLITTPSGKSLTLPCYYDSVWKARFAPQETGLYKYHFKLITRGKSAKLSKEQTFEVSSSGKPGFLHTKDYWTLQFDNGKPFRGVGENICWESRDSDDSKYFKGLHERESIYNYEYLLPDFAQNGGNFFRTWMCAWNLPIDYKHIHNNRRYTPSDAFYNPSATAKLDRLVELSDSLQLYIMLTLGQGGYLEKDGGVAASAEDFFVNPEAKARYKNRLRYIVARWGYSTSIGMWEFFNEVDNVQFGNKNHPIKGEYIAQWHDEMSAYLKSIDPYRHIVTTSISHRDIEGLNSIKTIDINQKHIYNQTSVIPAEINTYTAEFKKPYIIGEFGYEWDWSKNFNDFADGMDMDFKRGLWYGLLSPTPVTPMSWWWEFFENRGMTAYFRGVREISDQMLAAGKGSFASLSVQCGDAQALGVQCGEEIFVYVFNPEKEILVSDLTIETKENKSYNVQSYEPTFKLYKDVRKVEFTSTQIVLEDFSLGAQKEMVLLLKPVSGH